MEITVIPRQRAFSSTWSGGTTTEFFISPHQSSYQKRDFDIRISSATVDLNESEFTVLSGYDRIITPLTNQLYLSFQETADTYHLQPLDLAFFDGAHHTHCVGRATDFNVMVRKGLKATADVLTTSTYLKPAAHSFIYVPSLQPSPLQGSYLEHERLQGDTLYHFTRQSSPAYLHLEESGLRILYVTVDNGSVSLR